MERWVGRGLALVSVFFWAGAYTWGKMVLTWLSPLAASGARYGVAAILLLLIAATQANPFRVLRGHWLSYLVMGFIGVSCFQIFIFSALAMTSAVSTAVIMALTPVLTALGAALFLGETLSGRAIVGMVVSVAGAVVAVLGSDPRGFAGLSLGWGELLALCAALSMAFYTLASPRVMRRDVPALSNVAVVMVIGAIFLLPPAILDAPRSWPPTAAPLLGLAAIIIGSTIIAYLCWNRAIAMIGVAEPNLFFNFIPVLTVVLAAAQGEPPYTQQVVGALIVIAGTTWTMLPGGLSPHGKRAPGEQPVH
jgi:drug/metabolite transporter (DMT)-like permease